ncbi:MAG: hypothetical protein ABI367_05860 [Mucilaginibacter sp.]
MTKQAIIKHTVSVINQLPPEKAVEISDFADSLIHRYEELQLSKDLTSLASGESFDFLNDEEDLYTENDIKEPYAKR